MPLVRDVFPHIGTLPRRHFRLLGLVGLILLLEYLRFVSRSSFAVPQELVGVISKFAHVLDRLHRSLGAFWLHHLHIVAVQNGIVFLHRVCDAVVKLLQNGVILQDCVTRAPSMQHRPLRNEWLLTGVPHLVQLLNGHPVLEIMKLILHHPRRLLRLHESLNHGVLILILRATASSSFDRHG